MIKNYLLWGLCIFIFILIIKEVVAMIKAPKTDDQEPSSPEDLIPAAKFCPKCGESYKDEITICPGCNINTKSFDEAINDQDESDTVSTPPEPDTKFVKVFVCESELQANLIESQLNEEGIEAIVENQGETMVIPIESRQSFILVPEQDMAKAIEIIQSFINESNQNEGNI